MRDLSRFGRNYLEAGHYLECIFPVYNVRFISINDQFDSMELGESTGGLELAIRNLINQMYSKDISRKIKSAVDKRIHITERYTELLKKRLIPLSSPRTHALVAASSLAASEFLFLSLIRTDNALSDDSDKERYLGLSASLAYA